MLTGTIFNLSGSPLSSKVTQQSNKKLSPWYGEGRMIGKTTRRKVLTAAAAALGTAALADSTRPASAQTTPKTFVLVHGSWHGGWCLRRVACPLGTQRHQVLAP